MIREVIGESAYSLTKLVCIVYRDGPFSAVAFYIVEQVLYYVLIYCPQLLWLRPRESFPPC